MIEELEKMANLNIPKDLSSDEANKYLREACQKFEIKCPPPETTARLLDKVILLVMWFYLSKHIVLKFQFQEGRLVANLISGNFTLLMHFF